MNANAHARLAWILSIAGAVPFVASAAWIMLGPVDQVALATQVLITYSAIILSFLGGIQWGLGVAVSEQAPQSAQSLFLLSIVPALLGWLMLFIATPSAKVIVAIFLFGFVWVIDALLHLQKLIPAWFLKLRTTVSAIVLASLVAGMLRL
jgi:hypothetical protein